MQEIKIMGSLTKSRILDKSNESIARSSEPTLRKVSKEITMKKLVVYLVAVWVVGCAYEVTQSISFPVFKNPKKVFHLISDDRILNEILCDSIDRSQTGKCFKEKEQDLSTYGSSIKKIRVNAEITDSSSDYFKNMGKSLLTLTAGVFITNSAQVKFSIQEDNLVSSRQIVSSGQIGRWGILPFYAGLAATNFGTIFNTYRDLEHLQKYCLREPIGKIRKILEAEREEYCKEYSVYLRDSFYKVETEFLETINKENESEK